MVEFLHTILTFPTLPWTLFFMVCALYWLVAATGLLGHGLPDGGEAGHGLGHHHHDDGGLLARLGLGLGGVPPMVTLAVLSMCGWVLCYFAQLYWLESLPTAQRPPLNLAVGVLVALPALVLTRVLLQPLRRLFTTLNADEKKIVIGRSGTVSTPYADETYGMAQFEDGGAGLILQVRTRAGERFGRGERVTLLEYRPADHTYLVVAENEL